ncbi:MAG: DUF5301 domain-containing protein [Bacilli bacterium]|nr:DUF5301 domain-containing protein [Bacilli bacterium]
MKKKSRKLFYLGAVLLFVVVGIVIWYRYEHRQVYILDIPNSHNLSSISYELESGLVTVMTEEEMDKILNGIYELHLKTQTESVQDFPVDVEDLVAIRLYYKEEDTVGNFYLYKKKDKCYLEEPYNGIYKISEGTYNYIISLIEE